MAHYEVREDANSNPIYPFYIFSHEDGKPLPGRFASYVGAQKGIENIEKASNYDDNLFNAFFSDDDPASRAIVRPPAVKNVIFFDGQYEVGTIITDRDGNRYQTTKKSYHLSARDVADLEDGWDVTEQIGWHTPATLIEKEEEE
jgi:hypothetical protein